jgi:hypothetical protein
MVYAAQPAIEQVWLGPRLRVNIDVEVGMDARIANLLL